MESCWFYSSWKLKEKVALEIWELALCFLKISCVLCHLQCSSFNLKCLCLTYDIFCPGRGRDASNTGSGPEFFGFSHPTIQYLIQSLPGARKCTKYQWVKFELPKPQSKQGKRKFIEFSFSAFSLVYRCFIFLFLFALFLLFVCLFVFFPQEHPGVLKVLNSWKNVVRIPTLTVEKSRDFLDYWAKYLICCWMYLNNPNKYIAVVFVDVFVRAIWLVLGQTLNNQCCAQAMWSYQ